MLWLLLIDKKPNNLAHIEAIDRLLNTYHNMGLWFIILYHPLIQHNSDNVYVNPYIYSGGHFTLSCDGDVR